MSNVKFPSYNRSSLSEQLPLKTPAVIAIEASSRCCFNCYYCYQTLLDDKDRFTQDLNLDIFKKIVRDACEFENQIDTLVFARFGEPLINKHIGQMVRIAKQSNQFKQIKIITNAFLLKDEMKEALLDAELDVLEVSLQALGEDEYEKITGVRVDPETILEDLAKIKEQSTHIKIALKIFSDHISAEDPRLKQIESMVDSLIIEDIIDLDNGCERFLSKRGNNRKICSQPFYTINIDSSGNIIPCCGDVRGELSKFNAKDMSIYNYWNGEDLRSFQIRLLKGYVPRVCSICKGAQIYSPRGCELDTESYSILERLERRSGDVRD